MFLVFGKKNFENHGKSLVACTISIKLWTIEINKERELSKRSLYNILEHIRVKMSQINYKLFFVRSRSNSYICII